MIIVQHVRYKVYVMMMSTEQVDIRMIHTKYKRYVCKILILKALLAIFSHFLKKPSIQV